MAQTELYAYVKAWYYWRD